MLASAVYLRLMILFFRHVVGSGTVDARCIDSGALTPSR